jgi:microcystin-dependent protein
MRGRTLVGVTDGTMLGGTMAAAVDPTITGNPNYSIGTVTGANQIVLNSNQIPSHTHEPTVTSSITPNPHKHTIVRASSDVDGTAFSPGTGTSGTGDTSEVSLTVNVNVSNAMTGGGLGHSNIQPSIGCRYIIYIP